MLRFIVPAILIGISVAVFLMFSNPLYGEISGLRAQVGAYNEALDNSKALENERDKLTKKYNSIDPENIVKLQRLLPDNVDNIRLILEIEKLALPYGMTLKNVRYDSDSEEALSETSLGGIAQPAEDMALTNQEFGTWSLEFSTSATYNNFIAFLEDLENNLRLVDVDSIDFSSEASLGPNQTSSQVYQYNFKINTYWLKN